MGLHRTFDSGFLDEIRSRISLSGLIGRTTPLSRNGRNWKGCCPFHKEKTASFYVYDDHYHCFGCGVHGDAFSFLMQHGNYDFPQAVEVLAQEAGLALPAPDPKAAARAQAARSVQEVLAQAARFCSEALFGSGGEAARNYLENRGISQGAAREFSLGWVGDGKELVSHLKTAGFSEDLIVQSGLVRDEKSGNGRSFFFNRLMIPIMNAKGEIVSFGGRVIGDGMPKYLNGPETALFAKRRNLFSYGRAREAVRAGAPLVVVEGYLDVVSLWQAGLASSVAPLGTAVAEEQLELLWRLSDAPVLCFDGDKAGRNAARRACERAFPILGGRRSLKICLLPEGEDPDSFVRKNRIEAFGKLIGDAMPLEHAAFALLYGKNEEMDSRSPTARAAFRQELVDLAAKIPDRALASEFRRSFLDRYYAFFRSCQAGSVRSRSALKPGNQELHFMPFAARLSAPVDVQDGARQREEMLARIILENPEIFPQVEQAYGGLSLSSEGAALRAEIFNWGLTARELTRENLAQWAEKAGKKLRQLFESGSRTGEDAGEEEEQERDPAEKWWHFYAFMDLPAFEKNVNAEIEALVRNGAEAFPKSLQSRMNILFALKKGDAKALTGYR